MRYSIQFTTETARHLARLTARQRATVFSEVERQLLHQPDTATRNRKPMREEKPGYIAPWELRIAGNLRVYYDVSVGPPPRVIVVAVGLKVRDRVLIGDREVPP